MKTIDEVVHALEICDSAIDDCASCAYFSVDCENLRPLRADALTYLQKYQEMLDYQKTVETLIKPACIPDVENKPLTLEELKQMEGKPVWIVNERLGWAGWEIIWNFPGNKMETREDSWNIDEIGTEWNAYRKERENEQR